MNPLTKKRTKAVLIDGVIAGESEERVRPRRHHADTHRLRARGMSDAPWRTDARV